VRKKKRSVTFVRKAQCLALAATFLLAASLSATVLHTVTEKCPICGEENTFYGFGGWGGYVYHYASKFQMVFFPHTYPTSLWTCKKCHYTAWIGDFQHLPPEKIVAVRKAVAGAARIPEFTEYVQVPMVARLAVAERVYRELDKDDLFWSYFYQVKGYHLGLCRQTEEARQARLKARDLLKNLVADPRHVDQRKDLLIALAAMRHYTGDDQAAMETLVMASTEPDPASARSNTDKFLDNFSDKLIAEYKDRINSKSVPTDEESVNPLPGISTGHGIDLAGQDRLWDVRACGNDGSNPTR
jgi:hypothetical protein